MVLQSKIPARVLEEHYAVEWFALIHFDGENGKNSNTKAPPSWTLEWASFHLPN